MKKNNLTIGFDVTWMNVENASGGIFHYALLLIESVVLNSDMNVVAIIGPTGKGIFDHLSNHANFRIVLLDSPRHFPDVLKEEGIEVMHTPVQFHHHCTLQLPMINTLHDLQHFHYPAFFSRKEIEFRDNYYRLSAELSERIIVSFNHVKEDIVKFYGISPDKIDVCLPGMPSRTIVDQSGFGAIREKYGVRDRYLFYAANTWRHKNHEGLLRALKILHEEYGYDLQLVCTGYTYGDYFPQIKTLIENLDLSGSVIFTGYIPEDELLLLLSNATVAVIPTLYEAGSLSLAEAMLYEVPVLCSDVTSLPDIIGDRRFVFDPLDEREIAGKVVEMLTDERLREENRRNSRERISQGNWEKTSLRFIDVYRRAIEDFKEKEPTLSRDRIRAFEALVGHELGRLADELGIQSRDFAERIEACENDRAARGRIIEQQAAEFARQLNECERDRAARGEIIEQQSREFAQRIDECEKDRAARGEVIEQQSKEFDRRIDECEADRAARLEVINKQAADFTSRLKMLEAEIMRREGMLQKLQRDLTLLKQIYRIK